MQFIHYRCIYILHISIFNFSAATCCELADKSYGCCPLQNAVCCDDHIHCCPQNSVCEAGICVNKNAINGIAHKLLSKSNNSTCFSSQFVCPDDTTCCKGSVPGTFGCCPMENAVCCEDGQHCCPEDTVCDLEEETCIGNGFISEMYDSQKTKIQFPKYSHLVKAKNLSNVICPDSSFQCPNGYTCCQLPDGDWGCCPFVKATCCEDHLHCCPENMHCDNTSTSCSQGSISISSALKTIATAVNNVICPDDTSCADGTTCCKMNHDHYGCCPYPNAVCCSDLIHCCPSDHVCDDEQKQCVPKENWVFNVVSKFSKKVIF